MMIKKGSYMVLTETIIHRDDEPLPDIKWNVRGINLALEKAEMIKVNLLKVSSNNVKVFIVKVVE